MHRGTEENAEGRMFISKNKSTAAHNTEQFYYRLRIKGAPTNTKPFCQAAVLEVCPEKIYPAPVRQKRHKKTNLFSYSCCIILSV